MAHSSSHSERSIHDMLYDKDTPSMKMNESAIQSGKEIRCFLFLQLIIKLYYNY